MSLRTGLRWFLRALTGCLLVGVLLGAGAFFALSLQPTRDWVRGQLEELLVATLAEPVQVGAVSDLSFAGIEIRGLQIGSAGSPLLEVDGLRVQWSLLDLLALRIGVSVVLDEPAVDLVRLEDGSWNASRLLGEGDADEPTAAKPPWWLARVDVAVDGGRIAVRGLAPEPLDLQALSARARLRNGLTTPAIVEIASLSTRLGAQSRLRGKGTYTLSKSRVDATLTAQPLVGGDLGGLVPSLRPRARIGVSAALQGTLTHPEFDVELLTGGETRLAARGAAELSDAGPGVEATVEFQKLDPAALFVDAPPGDINGGGEASLRSGPDGVEEIGGAFTLRESRVDDFVVEGLQASLHTRGGAVDFELDSHTPGAELSARVRGTVALREPHGVRASGTIDVRDPAELPAAMADFLAGTRLAATFEAEVVDPQAQEPRGSLSLDIGAGKMRGIPVEGASLRVRLEAGRAIVEGSRLRADRTDIEASGWVELADAPGAHRLRAEVRGPLSLALVSDGLGVVETDVELQGSLADLDGRVGLISAGPIDLAGLRMEFSSQIDARHLGGARGEASFSWLGTLEASAPLSRVFGAESRPVDIRASLAGPGWDGGGGNLFNRLDLRLAIGKEEPGSLVLVARGRQREDRTEVEVSRLALHPITGPVWALAAPTRIAIGGEGVSLEDLRIDIAGGSVRAQGRFGSGATSRDDLDVRVADVDLGVFCPMLGIAGGCEGKVTASLGIHGVGSRPEIDFDLRTDHLTLARQDYGALVASARREGEGLRVRAATEGGTGGRFLLDGQLPLEPGALRISQTRATRFDLSLDDLELDFLRTFAGSTLRRLEGTAVAEARVRGTLSAPDLSGRLAVQDLVIGPAATGMVYRKGLLRASLDSARFSLEEFTLQDGMVTAGGDVDLQSGLPSRARLWLALDEALLARRSDADVTASGRVELNGGLEALHLEGDVRVDRAILRPNIAPGGGAPAPDPTVEVEFRPGTVRRWVSGVPLALGGAKPPALEVPADAPVAPKASGLDPWGGLSMRVGLALGESTVVRRHDANLRLSGGLELDKDPGSDLRVLGEIDGRRGWYIFQGRRFEIESARLIFSGAVPVNPRLDVRARYRSGDYRVRIRITGPARRPNLDLSSDPPLSQGDILAVILFGSPASQLSDSQGQVLQSQAFALVASYVAPDLQRSVLDTFGLASLTFSMPSGDTAGTVGVGRYFGDDIFVSVAHDFGGPTGGTQRQLEGLIGSSVTIQYSLSPQITLQGASSTEGESSVDLLWHRRY